MPDVFPIPAMAFRPYTVRREYRTEIIPSRSNREQRRALRNTPRKSIDYSTSITDSLWHEFNQAMTVGQRLDWYFPDQSRFVELPTGMAIGDTLTLAAVPVWAVAGQKIILRNLSDMEALEIESVVGLVVTFVAPTASIWPVNALMYPALLGAIATDVQSSTRLGVVCDANIKVAVNPASEINDVALTADETFNGRDVWLLEPHRVAPVEITHDQARELVDYGHGRNARFYPVDFASRLWRGIYPTKGTTRPDEIRSLFERMQGQRGEFYMPTFEYDLVPEIAGVSGTNTLRINTAQVDVLYSDSTTHRAVAVYLADGSVMFNRVTGIAQDAGDSIITFASNWTANIPVDSRISWMPVWRFATDILEISWTFDLAPIPHLFATTVLTFRMIEDLD